MEDEPPPLQSRWRLLFHPASAMIAGILAFPLAKVLYLPNYVFNFLTTLVHEMGHALFGWLMGFPTLPAVSVAGGGVAVHGEQVLLICLTLLAAIAAATWKHRRRPACLAAGGAAFAAYAALAFTGARELLPILGGLLLELGGTAVCFYVVLVVELQRPFERPLYALWGWWMFLNRGAETVLMLKDPAYRESQAVIASGLAAGLTSDTEQLRILTGASSEAILAFILALCILSPVGAGLAAWLARGNQVILALERRTPDDRHFQ